MKLKPLWLVCVVLPVAVLPLASCSKQNTSGTYVGKSEKTAFMLEIVETPDGHLTGKLTGEALEADGQLRDVNLPVTGTVHDQTIHLELRPVALFPVASTLDGEISGGELRLNGDTSGGEIKTLTLAKGDLSDYQAQMEKLKQASQSIRSARAKADAADREARARSALDISISTTANKVKHFHEKVAEYVPKFPGVIAKYRASTDRVTALWSRQQRIPEGQTFARQQVAFQINMDTGFSGPLEQMHDEIVLLEGNFTDARRLIETDLNAETLECITRTVPACATLSAIRNEFDGDASRMTDAFARAEEAYKTQKARQDQIAHNADQ